MDKLAAMRLLVRIVQTNSISRGAQAEGISAATATLRITNLERDFGAKLLNRSTRGISLTEQGEQCYSTSLRILDDLAQLENLMISGQADAAGLVRVNCNAGIGRSIVAPALPEFARLYPDIKLHLVFSDSRAQFVRDNVDFSIRIGGLEDQDLVMRKLGCARRWVVASPDYLRVHGTPVSPEDLRNHELIDFLLPDSAQVLPWEFRDSINRDARIFCAVNDADTRINFAIQGLGIVQVPNFMCENHVHDGKLVRVMQEWEVDMPEVSLLYPRSKHLSQRVKITMDYFTQLIVAKMV